MTGDAPRARAARCAAASRKINALRSDWLLACVAIGAIYLCGLVTLHVDAPWVGRFRPRIHIDTAPEGDRSRVVVDDAFIEIQHDARDLFPTGSLALRRFEMVDRVLQTPDLATQPVRFANPEGSRGEKAGEKCDEDFHGVLCSR